MCFLMEMASNAVLISINWVLQKLVPSTEERERLLQKSVQIA